MIPRCTAVLLAALFLVPSVHAQAPAKVRLDALGDTLPEGAIARLGTTRLKHDPGLWGTSEPTFSPDGKIVASVGQSEDSKYTCRSVCLWHTANGKEFPGPWKSPLRLRTTNLAFSPDSAILADAYCTIVTEGKEIYLAQTVVLWDVGNAKLLRMILLNRGFEASAIAFADGGKTLVCANEEFVRWFDVTTGKEFRSWKPSFDNDRPAHATTLEPYRHLSPDGRYLLAQLSWKGKGQALLRPSEVVIMDIAKGRETWRAKLAESFNRLQFAFSADGSKVVLQLDNRKVELRDTATGKVLGVPPLDLQTVPFNIFNTAPSLALSSNGAIVAIGGDSFVHLWNLDAPTKFQTIKTRLVQDERGFQLAFSPDGKSLAVWAGDGLPLYDVATLKERLPGDGHRSSVEHLRFSSDGKQLFTISCPANQILQSLQYLPEIIEWSVANWKQRIITSTHMSPWPNIGRASPDGSVYLGSGVNDHFKLHDFATGEVKGSLSGSFREVVSWYGAFSPDGKYYLFAGDDKSGNPVQRLYRMPSGKLLCDVPLAWRDYSSSHFGAISADGRMMAVFGDKDYQLRVFETSTGRLRHRFGEETRGNRSDNRYARAAFSWDGKLLASWNPYEPAARDICIWDLTTGKQLMRLPATREPFCEALFAWSPDGRMLAVVEGGKIRLWELPKRKVQREFTGHASYITSLAFSPNSRYLASGSADTTVLIWDLWDR